MPRRSSRSFFSCPRASPTSPLSWRLPALALALPGWPCGHRFLWTRPGSLLLSPLPVAEALVASDGRGIGESELFLEDMQIPSSLQKADSIGITEHGRADGLRREPRPLVQPEEQERQTILGERMPQLGEQEGLLCLKCRRLPGRCETSVLQIRADGTLSLFRQGERARASSFSPHGHHSFGALPHQDLTQLLICITSIYLWKLCWPSSLVMVHE